MELLGDLSSLGSSGHVSLVAALARVLPLGLLIYATATGSDVSPVLWRGLSTLAPGEVT